MVALIVVHSSASLSCPFNSTSDVKTEEDPPEIALSTYIAILVPSSFDVQIWA